MLFVSNPPLAVLEKAGREAFRHRPAGVFRCVYAAAAPRGPSSAAIHVKQSKNLTMGLWDCVLKFGAFSDSAAGLPNGKLPPVFSLSF
ncbi:MAG: hypothetical protein PHW69_04710, partial [Elusimicrobiaceae bacterium]|nr:hypothetical protein [Elusimicrobiaceae bacterium]